MARLNLIRGKEGDFPFMWSFSMKYLAVSFTKSMLRSAEALHTASLPLKCIENN